MTLEIKIVGGKGKDSTISEAHVHPFETAGKHKHHGLIVLTHRFIETEPITKFFFNSDFGINMNQNVAFSGTPERIHNGTDSSLYTFSEPAGTKATEDSTDRVNEGIATIKTFSNIDAGDSITIDGNELRAGTEWAVGANNAATATNLAAAVTVLSGYIGSTAAVGGGEYEVIITLINGETIATLTTNADGDEITVETLKAVKVDNMDINNVFQFAKGSDLTLSNFTAITMWINVDKDWKNNDSVDFYAYDTDLAVEVGNHVALEDYFTFGDFDTWHSIVIPLSDLGITSAATVDAFRFQQISKEGKAPKFYLDKIQIETAGNPAIFSLDVDANDKFHISEIVFAYADALDLQSNANASVPDLSYNKILGVTALTNGFTITRSKDGKTLFTVSIKTIGEHIAAGAVLNDVISDGTNTFLTLRAVFQDPLILTGDPRDTLTIQINDNLSGLLQFTASARGVIEI